MAAVASAVACFNPNNTIFTESSPRFKQVFMYMAGMDDEDEFDEFITSFDIRDVAGDIACPVLIVAGEDDEPSELELGESDLDDLELDVSDEDLALMEEFSDNGEPAGPQEDEPSLEDELGLEDALSESEADEPGVDQQNPEELAEQTEEVAEAEPAPEELEDEVVPVASDSLDEGSTRSDSGLDIDESALDDEDDFDFLAGTDEAATKLDLARAYIEMGDSDGARDILEEVALEGNEEQKAEAQELLKNLS